MSDWVSFVVNGSVGAWFLFLGLLKMYGLIAGIEGGSKASFGRRLCAT